MNQTTPMPTTPTKTIRGKVNTKNLHKLQMFFNQSIETTTHELLQNARRAKATGVDIKVVPLTPESAEVTVTDNGVGVTNMQGLVELLESGWDPETEGKENPAGTGFFSLAHLPGGIQVHSLAEKVHITPETFCGNTATVYPAQHLQGTRITFQTPQSQREVEDCIKKCARFYPIPTTLNNQRVPQERFLEGAKFTLAIPGGEIGVYTHDPGKDNINFHGLRISHTLPCPHPGWGVRVDIHNTELLDLVLPARNQVVNNQKLASLKSKIQEATYLAAAKEKKHQLPYKDFLEAKKTYGIELPEADAELEEIHYESRWNAWRYQSKRPIKASSVLANISEEEGMALETAKKAAPDMRKPDDTMIGYSWYPKETITNVTQVLTLPNGKKKTIHPSQENVTFAGKRPTKIEVRATITNRTTGKTRHIHLPTDIAFVDGYGTEALEEKWVTARGTWPEPETLSALFFSPSDEPDSDSWETQEEEFLKAAKEEITLRRYGNKALQRKTIEDALNEWDVAAAVKEITGKTGELRIRVTKEGIRIQK